MSIFCSSAKLLELFNKFVVNIELPLSIKLLRDTLNPTDFLKRCNAISFHMSFDQG